ncbi:MAG: putative metal-binding motif-containing protein [Sandaracinaceae bacterium]|nr:putative metal-binding motif-containing protein [Sandaracinaceae bacterium]
MADEFATCPRTFEAAALAAEPNRFYCLPTEGCCIDEDDDNYGEGVFCDGADCNDNDELVYPGADELCNGDDDNCDNLADNAPIDCAQQGCSFNGTNYVQTPTAACANGMCEQVTTNTCGLYSCVGGMADGDVCAGECVFENVENDNFCIPSAHCEAQGCVLDRPDGGVCTADSDCANDHCDSGICCSGVECCNDNMDCPGFPGAGLLCTDTPMCQGTIGSVTCNLTSFECESLNGAPDDAGCTSSVEANDCGPYPTVFCAGTSNQSAPTCATSCNVDGECDPNAHCDNNLCVLDLPDGNACDEGSDCGSSHCQNNFCCSGGDCCAMASQCPAIYSSASVCIDDATCQGTRSDAICTGNVCGTQAAIQDDSGCGTMTEADTCASFPSVFCNGMSTQSRPSCQAACTLDSQCDSGSHCDGLCIPDITDGGVCDENSDCLTDHCQNGRCCAGGDCCATPANCPASYSANSTCGDTSTCQGTRSDATCTASICGTQAGVPDDSGCNVSSVSSNCGAYPSATCAGTADQSAPVCSSSCSTDSNCDANAHCDNGVCILDVPNGDVCDEDSDCTAGHCQNGYCCASGDCCSAATNCPASYRSAAACTSNSTCQGSRTDATCTSNQCGTTAPINDDRGCTAGLMALSCGAFPDRFCDGQETQTPPVCAAACTLDSQCMANAHCDAVCVPDQGNGTSCDEDSDCAGAHCQNGFCCASGDCCAVAANCPASYGAASTCNTAATCQGTRSDATCNASFQCATQTGVADDTGCGVLAIANTCGFFPSVTCNASADQVPPMCTTGCFSDADCDGNAHCDAGACLPDLSDGNSCDEASDCLSSYCGNGFCCSGGDCCASAGNCPASYASPATCADPATCQGTRANAVCTGNVCGTQANVPDDSACNAGVEASDCGPYPSRYCNGLASQVAPLCGGSCSGNGQCDVDAHCSGGLCVPDLPNGGNCALTGAVACQSGLCNNGFCCTSGTCCATATDCPGTFAAAPACNNAATCQGTRSDRTCVSNSCGTQANVPDDSACSAVIVANTCGAYPSVSCNGALDQTTPSCGALCSADGDCDSNAHCDSSVCAPDLADGNVCDEDSDCVASHCQNGRCCAGGDCCSAANQCPAIYTTAPTCLSPSVCDGRRYDAVCTGFVCGTSTTARAR